MSDVKEGVKKGAKVAGKVVKWVIIAIVVIIVAVCAYSCYACTSVTKAVVDAAGEVAGGSSIATGSSSAGNVANTDPIKITMEDPLDVPFLHNDPRIEIGKTYEITR